MFPPFDEQEAYILCKKIIEGLESGSVRMVQSAVQSKERIGQGVMIGAAICKTPEGKTVMLCTVSGISKKLEIPDDFSEEKIFFVPPIVSQEKINAALFENDKEIHVLTDKINELKENRRIEKAKCKSMGDQEKFFREKRSVLTSKSLNAVYDLYNFHCIDGKMRKLTEICKKKLPPMGTGDCSAPKLLDYAFKSGFTVLSLCEVFYGGKNSTKIAGKTYAPCDERCALILPSMLGLKIIYRDSDIVVVEKQSGLLSVPGRGEEKQDSVASRIRKLFPDCIAQPSVHRLDMETSGLMVLAFTKEAHKELSRQFEEKKVYKEYTALLDGKIHEQKGTLTLYFRLDVENRPHQIWDELHGKKALTEYEKLCEEEYTAPNGAKRTVSRIKFVPHTGRTHQLRLASADIHGLKTPIIGDSLYGKCDEGERLMLHAKTLEFRHPSTGKRLRFESPEQF